MDTSLCLRLCPDQDNTNVLDLSQTTPEDVLRKLYRGYLALMAFSPSSISPIRFTSLTKQRMESLLVYMAANWNSYTLVTREATEDLRLSFSATDCREMISASTKYGNLESVPPHWVFWYLVITPDTGTISPKISIYYPYLLTA